MRCILVNFDRPIPAHLAELLPFVDGSDRISIWSDGWLKSAGVVIIKKRTDIATMRVTVHWRSMNAEPASDVKEVAGMYLASNYNCKDFVWRQSPEEVRMSKTDCIYFHCICSVMDASEL